MTKSYSFRFRNFLLFLLGIGSVLVLGESSCSSKKKTYRPDADFDLKGEIYISGAFALYPLTLVWAEEFQERYPLVTINISGGGAGKGVTDVINGMVDIAMVSRDLRSTEIEKGLYTEIVAKDAVVFIMNATHKSFAKLSQTGISIQKLEDIFINQKIFYWSELDSSYPKKEEEIHVYIRSDACGAAETAASVFKKHQEDMEGIGVYGDPGITSVVIKDKKGLGYCNLGFAYDLVERYPHKNLGIIPIDFDNDGRLSANEDIFKNLDELSRAISLDVLPLPPARNLYFVLNSNYPKSEAVERFLDFILNEGQEMVSSAGYAPIKIDTTVSSNSNQQ